MEYNQTYETVNNPYHLVVRDYDEAIEFFCRKLHFTLVEDTYQPEQDKRWVLVAPPGSTGATVLLARASTPEQESFIGRQTGGRVFLFLHTDDFWRDYNDMLSVGIKFVRPPKTLLTARLQSLKICMAILGSHRSELERQSGDRKAVYSRQGKCMPEGVCSRSNIKVKDL
jgi:catechol 2,3-dioxygenase-like lactoylglutathione lyase family enzyme